MNKKRFKIGDWVACSAMARKDYVMEGTQKWKRTVASKCETKYGQIVGIKRFNDGRVNEPNNNVFDGEYEQRYLSDLTTVYTWEIKCGMMNKVIFGLDKDVYPMVIPHDMKMPLIVGLTWKWTKENRQEMKKVAFDMKRDSKGRFLKA